MSALLPIAGLMFVGTITLGPNNLAVMRAAMHRGIGGAVPGFVGVLARFLGMLALSAAGAQTLLVEVPSLRFWITVIGSIYMAALGFLWVARADRPKNDTGGAVLPRISGRYVRSGPRFTSSDLVLRAAANGQGLRPQKTKPRNGAC